MGSYENGVLRIVQDIIRKRKKESRTPLCATEYEISAAAYKEYGLSPGVVRDMLLRLIKDGKLTERPILNGRSYYINQ